MRSSGMGGSWPSSERRKPTGVRRRFFAHSISVARSASGRNLKGTGREEAIGLSTSAFEGRISPTRPGAKKWSCASAAAWKVRAGTPATPRRASRSRISFAALSVKVTARISWGLKAPVATWLAMRRVMVVVLPDPAPARMQTGPRVVPTARRCSGLRPAKITGRAYGSHRTAPSPPGTRGHEEIRLTLRAHPQEALMLRSLSALCAALLLALAAAGCGGDDNGGGEGSGDTGAQTGAGGGEPIKVGFLYIGPPGDAGWTFQHDEARKFVEEQLPNVETTFLDSVPEANSGPAIDQLVSQGNKLIFATSFGYGDTVIQKAQQYPDVLFEHATGFQRAENVSTYFVKHWEPSFLLGMIAGRMTKTNHLGYVGSFPIPEVIRDINSFTLGAQSVNPDVKVQVVFINTWFDPPKEKQAAKGLIDAGADVLFGIEDSPSVLEEAEANDTYAATWNSDMTRFGPSAFLSAVELDWGKHHVERVKAG